MKKEIHPEYVKSDVTCVTCGKKFETKSLSSEIKVDVCSNCHPFYTGKATSNSKTGRVDRFNTRMKKNSPKTED